MLGAAACICMYVLSCVQLFAIPGTVTHQASLSIEFSRQVYWSGLPFPTPGDLPDPGIEPMTLMPLALADRFFTTAPPGKPKKESESVSYPVVSGCLQPHGL